MHYFSTSHKLLKSAMALALSSLFMTQPSMALEDYTYLGDNILKPQEIKDQTSRCERGDLSACEKVGIHYLVLAADHGIDIDVNMTLALRNLDKACIDGKGTPNSCLFLGKAYGLYGTFYIAGQKSESEYDHNQNHSNDNYTSRAITRNEVLGTATSQDIEQAHNYFDRGCMLRDPYSCSQMGSIYFEGIGTEVDQRKGLALFEQSCAMAQDLPEYAKNTDTYVGTGCLQAGGVYLLGKGVEQDTLKGLSYLELACTLNTAEGCLMLSNYYRQQNDEFKGISYLDLACKKGSADACLSLAMDYHNKNDNVASNRYLSIACNYHNGNACTLLADNMISGTGIKQDGHGAFNLVKNACDNNSSLACYYIAQMYQFGVQNVPDLRIKADINTAKRYFQRSCKLGNAVACDELKKL